MKKLLCLLTFGLVATGSVRAQVFRPGWVLPAQGDTLRGEVEDAGWEEAPTQVRFRLAAGADIRTFAAAGVRAFRLAGGRYFRYETLPLDRKAQTEQAAQAIRSFGLQRNQQPEAFLVEVLVDGPAGLLRTTVNDVPHYFVRRANQPVLELAQRSYLRQLQNGATVIADGNNYRSELTLYFGDCPAAVQAIGAFQVAALVKVVQAYNRQCATPPQAGTEYRPATRQRVGSYALGLVAGGRYNACLLQAEPANAGLLLDGYDLDAAVHPLGGVFADVSTPGRHFGLHLGVLLTSIGHRDQLVTQSGGLSTRLNNAATVLEVRLGGRYLWANNRREQHFFVGTGVTIPHALGYTTPTLTYYDASQQLQSHSDLLDAYPFGPLPYLEVGVQQGRFTLAFDGRVQQQMKAGRLASYLRQPSGVYAFTNDDYTARCWYVGATVGVALLWKP
ncbi:MAG: hypothetical protein ACRYFX_22320 [Janthinobacterium lividum]